MYRTIPKEKNMRLSLSVDEIGEIITKHLKATGRIPDNAVVKHETATLNKLSQLDRLEKSHLLMDFCFTVKE